MLGRGLLRLCLGAAGFGRGLGSASGWAWVGLGCALGAGVIKVV